ncbi:hypothetical protein AABC73_13595 [Pseudomonas sp. G.S.17]|uniref:hypothetical protein n=1 Tax=Pseudomonas sp. G.S.17 TaxID=3137451 RepID=UPI00311CAECC
MNDNHEFPDDAQKLDSFLRERRADFDERNYWIEHSLGAESHWLFIQAYDALRHGLYLPACTGFLTGVEASLRNTLSQVQDPINVQNLGGISTLSNSLLRLARTCGINIDCLVFPGEQDFEARLATRQSHVELVRIRHTLCHGNILEYISRQEGLPPFFTPECCRDLAETLHAISREWVASLGEFRRQASRI